MKAKQKTRRRFKLGKISTSKPAKRVLLEQEVGKAIRRHAAGDYGAAGTTLWRKNDIAAKEGEGRILSIYESKSGKRFWICTDYGHQSTTGLCYLHVTLGTRCDSYLACLPPPSQH